METVPPYIEKNILEVYFRGEDIRNWVSWFSDLSKDGISELLYVQIPNSPQ